MLTALVTGGHGFIGGAIARALEGYRVTVAGNLPDDPLTAERIAALEPVDVIVHCAGGSSVGASLQDPGADFVISVPPFEALFEHVRARMPTTRVVFLSSAAVYGNASRVPTPETTPLAPVSPYGVHKQQCEELCRRFGREHGIASVIVRLFSVYGPGLRKQLLWDACRKAHVGNVTFAGTGNEERDWLHVDDAASLVVAALQHATAQAPVFNGGSGVGVAVRDVVGQICRELAAPAPRFTGEVRAGDPTRYVADITRARALGWSPRIDIVTGVSQFVAWFRTQQ